MSDQDVRREVADEIASVLESRSDEITARSEGLADAEYWLHVGLARGFKQGADLAAKVGRRRTT